MTSLVAYSDQSDIELWGWPTWVFVIAVAIVLSVYLHFLCSPIPPLDPTELDTVDELEGSDL